MRRFLLLVLALLTLSPLARAQAGGTTLVSATVQDPSGNPYTNSQVNITFYDPGTSGKLPLLNGSTFQTAYTIYATDGFGHFSISLPDNQAIAASSGATGTSWNFSICYSDRVTCFAGKIVIDCVDNLPSTCTSGAMDISAAIKAIPSAPLPGTVLPSVTVNNLSILGCLPQLNSAIYIGGACSSLWGGGDIGSQFNLAYSTLPAAGGDILLIPQLGGGCYLFTTPIVMTTIGKYIRVRATAPASSTGGTSTSGACIQYTHTTATTAVTYDVTASGGGSYVGGEGWGDITILNSSTDLGSTPCTTNGGCGSSATGLSIGPVNGGAQLADWSRLSIKGFGTGIAMPNIAGIGWAPSFNIPSLAYNNIGMVLDGTEGVSIFGGSISVNGVGVKFTNNISISTNVKFFGTHFDSNTVLAIDGSIAGSAGIVDCHGCHWENLGTNNVQYVNLAGGAGTLNIYGGEALDDNTSGLAAPYWFQSYEMDVEGLAIYQGPGRPIPTALFSITTAGYVNVINTNPAVLTGSLGLAQWPHRIVGAGQAQEDGISHIQGTQVGTTTAVWNSGEGTGGPMTCTVAGTDTFGQLTCLTGSNGGTPGSSGAIVLNFYKAYTNTSAVCSFTLANPTGGGTWPATTVLSEKTTLTPNNTDQVAWNTNGAVLATSTNYSINYVCGGR